MLTEKQRQEKERRRVSDGRKLRCTKCGLIMRDSEPMCEEGEFFHEKNGCPNGGNRLDWNTPRFLQNRFLTGGQKPSRVSGIERVVSKKFSRARARGARLASKHKPK